ncbi:hypothetical protein BKH43_05495 [Helicobacter sp. 13S00401-1]|uniref:BspA family leucine-rich repeat surface protein n=1 Tax=Helicobacter sp. 13S00401-1 TaxID=1905758 RepID=UPI000BCD5BFD|nr:BspA family leucine-rich repeat surface protein [Helicobacter sp. 13S00401-1]PAF50191.1 hypothetical protein BKH43_05495 [Helicobacter sp. 13S00401-1]
MFDHINNFKAQVHYSVPNTLDINKALQDKLDKCKTSKNCKQPLVLTKGCLLKTKSMKQQGKPKLYKPTTYEELKKLVNNPNINLGEIDTSLITNMAHLFEGSKRVDFSGIETWDVSKVINMANMFNNAVKFNQPLDSWNLKNLKYYKSMFYKASAFKQNLDIWHLKDKNLLFTRP